MKNESHICRSIRCNTPLPTTVEEIGNIAVSEDARKALIAEMVRDKATYILKRGWASTFEKRCARAIAEERGESLKALRKDEDWKQALYVQENLDYIADAHETTKVVKGEEVEVIEWELRDEFAHLQDHELA